jgi:hypothetical protein
MAGEQVRKEQEASHEPAVGVQCSESVSSELIPIPNTDSLSPVHGPNARSQGRGNYPIVVCRSIVRDLLQTLEPACRFTI